MQEIPILIVIVVLLNVRLTVLALGLLVAVVKIVRQGAGVPHVVLRAIAIAGRQFAAS